MNVLATLFGRAAIKAMAGGLAASTASVVGAEVVGACDLETAGQKIGSCAGAFVVGHLVTWLSPKNKE